MPDASPWPEVDMGWFCWQQCCFLLPAYLFMRALDSSIAIAGSAANRCRVQPPAGSSRKWLLQGQCNSCATNLQQHRPSLRLIDPSNDSIRFF